MRLQSKGKAATILKEYKDQLAPLVKLVEWLRKNETRGKDIRYAIDSINNIKALEQRKNKLKEEVQSLKGNVQLLKEERDYLSDNGGDIKVGYS
jgi:cell division protein FtsB